MIPLSLKVETDNPRAAPFVTRLRASRHGASLDTADALLDMTSESALTFNTAAAAIRVFGVSADDVDNDVILVVPERGIARRLIRARSSHNSLLITEQCDQLCVMCSQPPKTRHVDQFDHLGAAVRLAPREAILGITGGEPTLHKARLFEFLERALSRRPDLHFRVLTNGQHFEESDRSFLTRHRGGIIWGIPLYAPLAEDHNQIVGKESAFERLAQSMTVLARAGSEIELRTVVIRENVDMLPRLADFVTMRLPFVATWALMQLENIGFGRMNWERLFHDSSCDFVSIGTALDLAAARGMHALLFNFPLCTVPEAYRRYAVATVSDWKRKHLPICKDCELMSSCGGFFEWYPERTGFSRLGLQ